MSTYGAQFWDSGGNLTFDTTAENVLFFIEERAISAATVGTSGVSYSYPAYTGKKIVAFMASPYGVADDPAGAKMQQCRVTYSAGVPIVSVYYEDPTGTDLGGATYPKSDGFLSVFWSGNPQ